MKNNRDLLQKLEQNGRRQLLFTQILCGLCAVLLVCVLILTVSVTGAANELTTLTTDVAVVLADLAVVAEDLAEADLGGIVENMNSLTEESQAAIGEAMKKLDSIDIASLNKAIRDLAAIVEPLAKVSKFFG